MSARSDSLGGSIAGSAGQSVGPSAGAGTRDPAAATFATPRAGLLPRELAPDEFALFAGASEPRRVAAGATIFRRGELGRSMFVIAAGSVQLEFGEGLADKIIGPREFFGELALFIGNHARVASAVAETDCVLHVIEHAAFEALLDREPALLAQFMRRSFSYLVASEQRLIQSLRRRNEDLMVALDSLRQTRTELSSAQQLVRTDELTGLANRRGLYQYLDLMFGDGGAQSVHPALLLVDVDRFKQINDRYGHLAGDLVLQAIADEVSATAQGADLAARLGGDEFALVMHVEDAAELSNRAIAVATAVRRLRFPAPHESLRVTVSAGGCLCDPAMRWPSWYSCADAALYQAKGSGGDGWKLAE